MTMGIYKRGNIWWVAIRRKNFEYVSGVSSIKKEAEKVYAEKLNEALSQKHPTIRKTKELSFKDLTDEYIKNYVKVEKARSSDDESFINHHILPWFESKSLNFDSLRKRDILDFRAFLMMKKKLTNPKKTLSPASVNRIMASLSGILSYAVDCEYIEINPCSKIAALKENNERDIWFREEEVRGLLGVSMDDLLWEKIFIGLATGLRLGSIKSLCRKYLDFDRKMFILPSEKMKARKKFNAPMSESVYNLLLLRFEGLGLEETPYDIDHKDSFLKVLKEAKLHREDVDFRTLRHTFNTWLAKAGVEVGIRKVLMHHSVRKEDEINMRYTHDIDEQLREAARKLDFFFLPIIKSRISATVLLQSPLEITPERIIYGT